MRPPLLTDEMILTAIRDVATKGRVTGVAVRALLASRFGARGGVARIYRLMDDWELSRRARAPSPIVAPADATQDLQTAVHRARLAEEREQAHQARWAREIDEMRTRLAAADRAVREVTDLRLRVAELHRALASAQDRIRQLEAGTL